VRVTSNDGKPSAVQFCDSSLLCCLWDIIRRKSLARGNSNIIAMSRLKYCRSAVDMRPTECPRCPRCVGHRQASTSPQRCKLTHAQTHINFLSTCHGGADYFFICDTYTVSQKKRPTLQFLMSSIFVSLLESNLVHSILKSLATRGMHNFPPHVCCIFSLHYLRIR